MEDDAREFLVAIIQTASLILLWMMTNVVLGIYLKLGLFESSPSLINILYYFFFAVSLFFLARHIIRKWKKIRHF